MFQPAPRAETIVVVVPSRHDGHVGAVVVEENGRREVLNTAYASARTREGSAEIQRGTATVSEVEKVFAVASAALPHKPITYTLYFELAKPTLTAESSRQVEAMLTELAQRQAAEITVTGHTDRRGTNERNAALSLARAEQVRRWMIERGVAPGIVTATGLGEMEPVVPTDDEVSEPKNRRVEILVR